MIDRFMTPLESCYKYFGKKQFFVREYPHLIYVTIKDVQTSRYSYIKKSKNKKNNK